MKTRLGKLQCGQRGKILAILPHDNANRLLEMGFTEGAGIHVAYQAPLGGNPIAVRVNGALIAIKREDAEWIEIELQNGGDAP